MCGVTYCHKEIDMISQIQILDKATCISLLANVVGKGINPSLLSTTLGKIVGQTGLFSFGWATILGEEKL